MIDSPFPSAHACGLCGFATNDHRELLDHLHRLNQETREWEVIRPPSTQHPECDSKLYAGPGHQSAFPCTEVGEHEIHRCLYDGIVCRWRGDEGYTGFFDEPCDVREANDA